MPTYRFVTLVEEYEEQDLASDEEARLHGDTLLQNRVEVVQVDVYRDGTQVN